MLVSDIETASVNSNNKISFYEFWPIGILYFPVILQWLILALKYRSLSLPLLANPRLTISGMVGVGKSELMKQATGECHKAILSWNKHVVSTHPAGVQAESWLKLNLQQGFTLPFVCKPDIGCRGAGIKLIHDLSELEQVICAYPEGTALIAQKLASWEPEAGIFFVKMPQSNQGEIISLGFKLSPHVVGDGEHTLKQLVEKDERANKFHHVYQQRHEAAWNQVQDKGQVFMLGFSASHCKGAHFLDARKHITSELTAKINTLMAGLPEFYYGRLDVKFSSLEELKQGKTIEIIEINGASAESLHIWDKNGSFIHAMKTLLWQYQLLFKIGDYQRSIGYKPPGMFKLLKHLRIEMRLARYYPVTD